MKKVIICLLTMLMILSMCACADESESSTPAVATEVMEDIAEQHPLFIRMGDEITINGNTYTAAMLCKNAFDNVLVSDEGAFVVNRITGCVYLRTSSLTHRANYVTSWLDTGLIYEGTVNVSGIEIQIPEAVNK